MAEKSKGVVPKEASSQTGASEPAADSQPERNEPEPRMILFRETPYEVVGEDAHFLHVKSPRGLGHRIRKTKETEAAEEAAKAAGLVSRKE